MPFGPREVWTIRDSSFDAEMLRSVAASTPSREVWPSFNMPDSPAAVLRFIDILEGGFSYWIIYWFFGNWDRYSKVLLGLSGLIVWLILIDDDDGWFVWSLVDFPTFSKKIFEKDERRRTEQQSKESNAI